MNQPETRVNNVNFKEAEDQFDGESVSMLVNMNGSLVAISEANKLGGVCDCCRYDHNLTFHQVQVVRVVDLKDMKVLFEDFKLLMQLTT